MFKQLPLAAIVNGDHFCVHGGISNDLEALEQINDIDRVVEPPKNGPFNDLLWSDPLQANLAPRLEKLYNVDRMTSIKFGLPLLKKLLQASSMKCLVRAHEEEADGYKFHLWEG